MLYFRIIFQLSLASLNGLHKFSPNSLELQP
jgi:hypothetical protein